MHLHYSICDGAVKQVKRSDYLKTIEGQAGLRRKRRIKKLHFVLDGQEPKSKNAISEAEKEAFQNAILNTMVKLRRRHFRAPVALEFDFFPTENNPPALHTMPKNYLDLLEGPRAGVASKRKRIVFENDRQVVYLAAKYHLPLDKSGPSIWLKVAPSRNLVADIALLDMIQREELNLASGENYRHRPSPSWDDLRENNENARQNDDAAEQLREHENNKQFLVSRFGQDVYEAWREIHMRDVQNQLLRTLALTPSKLISLLSPLFSEHPSELSRLHEIVRDNLISEPFAIDLRHSDLGEGESSQYKSFVKRTMSSYREKHSCLFPLIAQVGITILFQPPASGGIDLDNLARRIVPFVNEELKPPNSLLMTINADRYTDPNLKQWYQEKQSAIKRMPRHSITHYQVVQLPRLTSDSQHGFVRLILEPGEHAESLWGKVENLADKWLETVT